MPVPKKYQLKSAEEFVRLRLSADPEEYVKAAQGAAALEVWQDTIERYPDMRVWVAHNKSVPLEILRRLALDRDPEVRRSVAIKRKLDGKTFELLSKDPDESVRRAVYFNSQTPPAVRADMSPPQEYSATRQKN